MADFNPIDVVIEKAQNIVFDELYIPEEFLNERPKSRKLESFPSIKKLVNYIKRGINEEERF